MSAIDRVREAQLSALRYAVGAEAVALRAIKLLRAGGIEPVVFKGLANAHLDEENPAHRGFFDADMLVRREHLHSAVDLLERADFDRTSERLPRWWERRYTRAIELRHDAGTELDLHATLAAGYFGAILDLESMFQATEMVDIGGVECTAFDPTGRFLVSAFAIVLSRGPRPRLFGTSFDNSSSRRRTGDRQRVGQGRERSSSHGAVLAVADEIGLEHEAVDWATSVSPSPSGRRALNLASRAEQIGWSADARSALMACRGLEKVTFVAGVAWPARRIQRLSTKQRGLVRGVTVQVVPSNEIVPDVSPKSVVGVGEPA